MNIPDIIPLFPNRVWRTYEGGMLLDKLEGKEPPKDSHFPEDWIASTTIAKNEGREDIQNEGLSKVVIDNEEFFLKDLMRENPNQLLGQQHYLKYGPNTQFLLKLLDSAIRLHIQCHPTRSFAQMHLNANSGKTEAYYIFHIREKVNDPYIYLGFQDPPSPKELKATIQKQDTETLLSYFEKIPIKEGDSFIVPGGFPHAIGEGIFMIEIMEPTDFCVRIEFQRGDYVLPNNARFMGRDVKFATSMFNYDEISIDQIKDQYFLSPNLIKTYEDGSKELCLVDGDITDCFRLKKLIIMDSIQKIEDSFYIGIVIKGQGRIESKKTTNSYALGEGDKFFIPHKSGMLKYNSDSEMELILAYPPF